MAFGFDHEDFKYFVTVTTPGFESPLVHRNSKKDLTPYCKFCFLSDYRFPASIGTCSSAYCVVESSAMNLEFAKSLDKARDSVTEVRRVVSSHNYPGDKRTLLLTGLLAAMTQYHQSVLQLTKSGAVASSYALTRAIVRDMRYGLWLISCATNEQVLQLEKSAVTHALALGEVERVIGEDKLTKLFFQRHSYVASGAHLTFRAGVCASACVPQWNLKLEEPHGANDLDSQAHRHEKSRGGWNGLHLPASVSGVDADWQAYEGKGLERVGARQRKRWHLLPGAVLRFVWKKLQ